MKSRKKQQKVTMTESSKRLKFKKKSFLDALKKSLGIVSIACEKTGLGRHNHYRWLRDDADYNAAYDEILESTIDFVETSLYKQIKNENTQATLFYLKTKGRKRGYNEVIESKVELIDKPDIIKIYLPHNGRDQNKTKDI